MRVLVAPDKFAGTLTAVEAAEAIAAGWRRQRPRRRARPGADGRRRARASSTSCTPRSAASCSPSRSAGRTASRCPATVLRGRRHGVRRERPGVRPAPDRTASDAERRDDVRRRRAGRRRGRRAARTTVVVGLGGSGTNDGGAGLLAALGATADVPLDAGRGRPRRRHRVDLAPARERGRRRRGWSRPATSTTR